MIRLPWMGVGCLPLTSTIKSASQSLVAYFNHILVQHPANAVVSSCSPGAAGRSDEEGVGVLFLAHRGAGAYSTGLWGDGRSLTRIHVKDTQQLAEARFMESYESRHSNHSFTAQVVSGDTRGNAGSFIGACRLKAWAM